MRRLVVADIDGTLVSPGGLPDAALASAVRRARDRGIGVTFATARTWIQTRPIVDVLGLPGLPIVCCQGSEIVAGCLPDPGRRIVGHPLDTVAAIALIGFARRHGLLPAAVVDGRHVFTRREHLPASIMGADTEPQIVRALERACESGAVKVMAYGSPEAVAAAFAADDLPGSVTTGRSANLLEWTRADIDKGSALRELCAMTGIAREQVVAMGDGENDLPLFAVAGHRIAVAGGSAALASLADTLMAGPEEGGAAAALDAID